MKNIHKIILALTMLFAFGQTFAQSTIESIIIEKQNRIAVKLYVDQTPSVTSDALVTKLKRSGLSGRSRRGVTIYSGVILSEISTNKMDIYTSVQKSGKGSVVYMAASRGYDNFSTPEDTAVTNRIISFLNTLVVEANLRAINIDLTKQNELIEKQEKEYQKLLNEEADTKKIKTDADVKLTQLKYQIDAKRLEILKLKQERDNLKNKRVSNF
jgi:hypothetical protein